MLHLWDGGGLSAPWEYGLHPLVCLPQGKLMVCASWGQATHIEHGLDAWDLLQVFMEGFCSSEAGQRGGRVHVDAIVLPVCEWKLQLPQGILPCPF